MYCQYGTIGRTHRTNLTTYSRSSTHPTLGQKSHRGDEVRAGWTITTKGACYRLSTDGIALIWPGTGCVSLLHADSRTDAHSIEFSMQQITKPVLMCTHNPLPKAMQAAERMREKAGGLYSHASSTYHGGQTGTCYRYYIMGRQCRRGTAGSYQPDLTGLECSA